MLKVANVHEVYITEEFIVVGIKTNGPVDEKAIRAVLRKHQSPGLFSVTVPAEPAV